MPTNEIIVDREVLLGFLKHRKEQGPGNGWWDTPIVHIMHADSNIHSFTITINREEDYIIYPGWGGRDNISGVCDDWDQYYISKKINNFLKNN